MTTDSQSADEALKRLSVALETYQSVSRLTTDEALEKKGNDLRIQLYRGFRKYRWKGRNIAQRESERRAKLGKGTLIRESTKKHPGNPPAGLRGHAALVWRELERRTKGIGVLATSFLLRRWRRNSKGKSLVTNKTSAAQVMTGTQIVTDTSRQLGLVSRVEQRPGLFRLSAFTPGVDTVSDRYGIATQAMDAVTTDIVPYLQRKLEQETRNLWK